MAVLIKIQFEKRREITVRKWREATKKAFMLAAVLWYRHMLPDRFRPGFHAPWIRPRSKAWLKRKRRLIQAGVGLAGYQDTPNIFTGFFRDCLLQSADIRAYPTRASVRFKGPGYVIQNPVRLPDKFLEVTKIFPSERQTLGQTITDSMVESFPQWRGAWEADN